jgi:hypothetical protein
LKAHFNRASPRNILAELKVLFVKEVRFMRYKYVDEFFFYYDGREHFLGKNT